MGKKGKGRKGKGESESTSESNVQRSGQKQPGSSRGTVQQQPGSSRGTVQQQPGSSRGTVQQQPGSSRGTTQEQFSSPPAQTSVRGHGRGRGQTQQSFSPRSPGAEQKMDTSAVKQESESLKPGEIQEQKIITKGRGRGKAESPQSSVPSFPEFEKKDIPEELTTYVTREKSQMQDVSTKKKVSSKVDESLLAQIAGISLEHEAPVHFPMAKRPGYVRIDDRNRIMLYVNYFKLDYRNAIIYHYDVDIFDSDKNGKKGRSVLSEGRTAKEDKKKDVKFVERQKFRNMGKAKCRIIISETFKNEALRKFCPVYDGQKNLFTSKPLPCQKTEYPVDIMIEGKQKRYFVMISAVSKEDGTNQISLEPLKELYSKRSGVIPQEVLLVYETIMNHREPNIKGQFEQVQFRNSFFSLYNENDKSPLGCGYDIWFGYHQAVQLTELGPVVVINVAAKAFHKAGSVIDYANDVLERYDIRKIVKLERWQIKNLTDALKGVTVKVTHQNFPRKYKVKAVTELSAKEIMLEQKNISVAQYMLQTYNRRLLYPNLPCLHMQTNTNKTFIPMETCEIVEGQPKIGKLSGELTSKMIRQTAIPPKSRMENIKEIAVGVNERSKKYMDAFNLLLDIKLMKVNGRIIATPQLSYDGPDERTRIAKPDIKGVWRIEDGKKFYRIVTIDNWCLISFADSRRFGRDILEKYCDYLSKSARKCGMKLERVKSIDMYGRNDSSEVVLRKAKQSGAKMVIVVLNRKDNYHSYDEIKFLADFKFNLVTQCMEDKTLSRINDQITTNVCLKINVKLGGINHILLHKPQIFSSPVMVLGIDAIHWSRGFGYPSIVAVVGSLNPTASRYALTCDLQRNIKRGKISQEIVDQNKMQKLVTEILEIFKETNKMYPRKIIVFRDGVSEGQFQHALDYEVSGIQKACQDLMNTIVPITYIVVQKRHQTRFFPVNPSQGVGKNQNVPPGTNVDKDVTHPVFFDFFICSHEGIQGTSKPAHYTVLHDDNKFQTEDLQNLCYFLCYTYVRCTRSVSLPAPVMYADLAAARAKKYADFFIASDTRSSVSDDSCRSLPSQVEEAIRSMKMYENNMFYV